MLSDMKHLPDVRAAATDFGKAAAFTPGATYADYDKSVDKTAEYGLAGLVAAGAGVVVWAGCGAGRAGARVRGGAARVRLAGRPWTRLRAGWAVWRLMRTTGPSPTCASMAITSAGLSCGHWQSSTRWQ